MNFKEKETRLKDGRSCVLKPTYPEYAGEMLEFLKTTAGESEFVLRYPDEVTLTLEEEKVILQEWLSDPRSIMMVALVNGKVAGNASILPIGNKRKVAHRCTLAIALFKEFWGLGIGTAMINYLSELASNIGYSQIELEVVSKNFPAQALYRKCGFIETGYLLNALRMNSGEYYHETLMCKLL